MQETSDTAEAQKYYKKATHYIEFDEVSAAIDALRKATAADPNFAQAWHLLGSLLQDNGLYDEARSCFKRAVELDPLDLQLWARLGLFEFSQERYRAARKALNKYVNLGGDDLEVLTFLAKAAFRLSDCKTVLSITKKILDADEEQYEAWELRGLCQARKEKLDAAIISLNMALEIHADSVYAMNTVGDLCYERENYEGALTFYRSSIAVRWEQPRILFRCGTSLWMIGRWQAAIPMLEEYVKLVPDDPRGWNNLGVIYREKGEIKRALESYHHALELDPDFEIARANLETAKNKRIAL